jgi:hypothetical protein
MSQQITRPTDRFLTRAEVAVIMEARELSMAARARLLGISSQQLYDKLVMRLRPCRPDVVARVRANIHRLEPLALVARQALASAQPPRRRPRPRRQW